MFMKGDLPGLSKCWFGTIGSCQYSTFLPVFGSIFSPDEAVTVEAAAAGVAAWRVPAK